MPKSSGESMKVTRHPDPPAPKSRPIMKFACPQPGPHHEPASATPPKASNELAAEAVRKASSPGRIDPRQMRS